MKRKVKKGLIYQLKHHRFERDCAISPPLERLLKECFKSTRKSKNLVMWLPWDGVHEPELWSEIKKWRNKKEKHGRPQLQKNKRLSQLDE